MATIIWCDRVRHIVEESRSEVARLLDHARGVKSCTCGENSACSDCPPEGGYEFVYFTPYGDGSQRALNVRMISSFEAVPGDGI